ncbi:MAG TPA: hypothetical protein VML75_02515 [Kofleriaceae bacterium]|nr:hypothetical protein [Kofleriaceae bacterium]
MIGSLEIALAVIGAGLAALAFTGLLGGCAGSGARECFEHAECASGLCSSDGTCVPGADADPDGPDAGVNGDADLAGCRPDHDGVIARDEISLAPGRTATFRVATDTAVNTAGQLQSGGDRVWNFAGSFAGDQDEMVVLIDPASAWYADLFPTATYATRLSSSEDLLGVFELTDDALLLLGVVSPQAGVQRTELTYDPPVAVLTLPLTSTSSWQTDSTITGLAQGFSSFYSEQYASQVDAIGELQSPYGNFPVQRVRTQLTRTVGASVVTVRSFLFVSECFGTVASVTSNQYEPEPEFTQAAELRRIAP